MRHEIVQVDTHEDRNTYKITCQIPLEIGWIDEVRIYIWKNNEMVEAGMVYEKCDEQYAYFFVVVELKNCPLYHYCFSFKADGKFEYYKKRYITDSTEITREECFKLSVNFDAPNWAKGCVAYQIFPDRFCKGKNSVKQPMPRRRIHENWDEKPLLGPDPNDKRVCNNDFFGGDFAGIMEKIDYIADLGIDMVYFNPIVTSQSTHRYDTADYFHPDPYLGTEEELMQMIEEFHKRGIKVVLDGVYNHTGNDSIYYNEYGTYDSVGAYQSEESPYSNMYERDEFGNIKCWWGFRNEPVCNKDDIQYKKLLLGEDGVIKCIVCKWKADGIRFDVIDELPEHTIRDITAIPNKYRPNDFYLCGEVWDDVTTKENDYFGCGIPSFMNLFLTNGLLRYYMFGNTEHLKYVLNRMLTVYPKATLQTSLNSTSTHDMTRLIELLGCPELFDPDGEYPWNIRGFGDLTEEEQIEWQNNHKMTDEQYEKGKMMMKSYLTALAHMFGIFTIFYGDEVGRQGIGTLLNRGTYPWGKEDKELLEFVKDLIKNRKSQEFLKEADFEPLKFEYGYWAYECYDENSKILVVSSRVPYSQKVDLPDEYKDAELIFSANGSDKETLQPGGAIVLKK